MRCTISKKRVKELQRKFHGRNQADFTKTKEACKLYRCLDTNDPLRQAIDVAREKLAEYLRNCGSPGERAAYNTFCLCFFTQQIIPKNQIAKKQQIDVGTVFTHIDKTVFYLAFFLTDEQLQ